MTDAFFEESFAIDTARFHIYAVEWTPTQVDFYIDNRKIRTIGQSPQYPMQFMLTLYEHPFERAWTGPYNPKTHIPKRLLSTIFAATSRSAVTHRLAARFWKQA
uniref:CAZy families GH16 protein n=1 Tax=uncultured Herpetosiphon sp. TaxID=290606 RepID=A0A060C655_9CHLR|nr:CAZy families GH16 protein [uncultured Herpetosiphon sp.]